jgi:DNA polymerase/3'-5' exonuclease PolX
MAVHNADIARVFDEIADLLEIQEANPFRVRAYRDAARTVENLTRDLAATVGRGKPPPRLPGIGADLAAKIGEIAATGSCASGEPAQPLMQTSGSTRATLHARPAASAASTTAATSL